MDELYKQALGWMRADKLPLQPSSDKPPWKVTKTCWFVQTPWFLMEKGMRKWKATLTFAVGERQEKSTFSLSSKSRFLGNNSLLWRTVSSRSFSLRLSVFPFEGFTLSSLQKSRHAVARLLYRHRFHRSLMKSLPSGVVKLQNCAQKSLLASFHKVTQWKEIKVAWKWEARSCYEILTVWHLLCMVCVFIQSAVPL